MTSRKIQLERDYYDEGIHLYKKKVIELQSGITILVGCNGIGKSTLLKQIKANLHKNNIPYIMFDNLKNGGNNAISEAGCLGDFGFMATAMQSSEGENIVLNIEQLSARLGQFVKTGTDPKEINHKNLVRSIAAINGEDLPKECEPPKERWILLDAIDSGLSVDNIVDIKEQLFQTILEYNFNNDIYIIVSANEYEMVRNEKCFDVYNGKYVNLKNYEEYRNFILDSKEWKNKRS